jgi:hypothetical protein
MSGVINDIWYTNTEGTKTVCRVSLMTYDILTLKELGHYVRCH